MASIGFASTLAFSLTGVYEPSQGVLVRCAALLASAALVLLLLAKCGSTEKRLALACKGSVPLVVFGLLVHLLFGGCGVYESNALVLMGYSLFMVSSFYLLFSIARHFKTSTLYVFSIGLTANYLGMLLGGLVSAALLRWGLFSIQLFSGVNLGSSIVLFVILVLMIVGFFLFDEQKVASLWGHRVEEGTANSLIDLCEAFAVEHALTARQTEVLRLLCKGKTAEQISEALVIANGTTRAHIRGIYEKANVHSYPELIERIQAVQDR